MDLCIIMVGGYSIMDWDDRERSWDDGIEDEIERLINGGYSEFMEEVKDVRDLTYRIVYEKYAEPKGMTKQQFYDMLIEMGLKDYSKHVVTCNNIQAMKDDMKINCPYMTENECVSLLCDRGLMILAMKEYNVDSSHEIL